MKTAIKILKGFLIDRLETIVNELFHYNNFLVDQLEKVVNQFISFHCVTITKNNPRKQVSSRFLIYQLEKVLIDYIYIPLDAKIPRPYFSREQLHTFPVDRLENVFEKRQTFRRFSTVRHELEVSRKRAKLLRIEKL